MNDPWTYREGIVADTGLSLIGFDVEATDGKIGTVEEESNVVGDSFLVVDTGFLTFDEKVLMPAATITRVDPEEKKVFLANSKEEIDGSPEFDENTPGYRRRVGDYYTRIPQLP